MKFFLTKKFSTHEDKQQKKMWKNFFLACCQFFWTKFDFLRGNLNRWRYEILVKTKKFRLDEKMCNRKNLKKIIFSPLRPFLEAFYNQICTPLRTFASAALISFVFLNSLCTGIFCTLKELVGGGLTLNSLVYYTTSVNLTLSIEY